LNQSLAAKQPLGYSTLELMHDVNLPETGRITVQCLRVQYIKLLAS